MHVQHKLVLELKRVSNHQPAKCYKNYQELIKEGIVEKDTSNLVWKNASVSCLWRKETCHALPHWYDIQPKACRSVQPYRTQWMQRHTTSHLENENKKISFSVGIRWLKAASCTPPGTLLRYLWGMYSMSRLILMIFVADLIKCRLNYFMSVVACRPVTPRLWSEFFVWLL
jgi:hypothetical protein